MILSFLFSKTGVDFSLLIVRLTKPCNWHYGQMDSSVLSTLCNPIDCRTPGFPVLHHLAELAQTDVHWAQDAIQSFHPQSSPSPPTFNLCQHQGLFQWVGSWHQVDKVLELQLQYEFSSPRDSQESSSMPQLKSINSSELSFPHCPIFIYIYTWLLEKPYLWLDESLKAKWHPCFLICCLEKLWLFFQRASIL